MASPSFQKFRRATVSSPMAPVALLSAQSRLALETAPIQASNLDAPHWTPTSTELQHLFSSAIHQNTRERFIRPSFDYSSSLLGWPPEDLANIEYYWATASTRWYFEVHLRSYAVSLFLVQTATCFPSRAERRPMSIRMPGTCSVQRLRRTSSWNRFVAAFTEYLDTVIKESADPAAGLIRSSSEYLELRTRRLTIGGYSCLELDLDIPDQSGIKSPLAFAQNPSCSPTSVALP